MLGGLAQLLGAAPKAEDSPFQKAVLLGLNGGGKHVYAGTVPAHVKAKRRAANKVARRSRRINRRNRA